MIYAMSDLHGCYDLYIKMLEKTNFSDNDTLYVLGDVVDRGPDGIKILRDVMKRNNVTVLLGNHDYTALKMFKALVSGEFSDGLSEAYSMWMMIGGGPTNDAFLDLEDSKVQELISYMDKFPLYREITVNNRSFWLSHSVPEKSKMLGGDTLYRDEYIAGAPEYDKQYFADKYIVTGHTPTYFIGPKYEGKIYMKNNHIAIDCGAVFGNPLGCICLDTLEEFYVEE